MGLLPSERSVARVGQAQFRPASDGGVFFDSVSGGDDGGMGGNPWFRSWSLRASRRVEETGIEISECKREENERHCASGHKEKIHCLVTCTGFR